MNKSNNIKITKSKKILLIILLTIFTLLYLLTWYLIISPGFPYKEKEEAQYELTRDEYIKINEITFYVPLEFKAHYDEINAIFEYKEDDNLSCKLMYHEIHQNIIFMSGLKDKLDIIMPILLMILNLFRMELQYINSNTTITLQQLNTTMH